MGRATLIGLLTIVCSLAMGCAQRQREVSQGIPFTMYAIRLSSQESREQFMRDLSIREGQAIISANPKAVQKRVEHRSSDIVAHVKSVVLDRLTISEGTPDLHWTVGPLERVAGGACFPYRLAVTDGVEIVGAVDARQQLWQSNVVNNGNVSYAILVLPEPTSSFELTKGG